MSESETHRDDRGATEDTGARPDGTRTPGPGPEQDDLEDGPPEHPADPRAIPGEHPEDNPDKEGEERFDAG